MKTFSKRMLGSLQARKTQLALAVRLAVAAVAAYAAEITAVRRDGLIRGLPIDAAEGFFALGFSLEQMRQNLNDLDRCHVEWSVTPAARPPGIAA